MLTESRYAELIDQCNSLKKGREESDEREKSLVDLKAIEQKYNEHKVAQVLLTLPYSFSQMGIVSGVIFQIIYGILGSWTAYLISALYVEYRTRKEKDNVSFKNHIIQWFEALDGLLGSYWKVVGLAFNCTFLLFGSVIQLIASVILMLAHQFITFGFACTPLYFVWEKVIGVHNTTSIFARALARLPIVIPIWFLTIIFPLFGPINSAVGALLVSFTVYIIPALEHTLTYRTASGRELFGVFFCKLLPRLITLRERIHN
ncbi:hypothetical protein CASFOL_031312 [Castilleja foliolosa]|uniref:Amino acid transporter transmembrane domain-containing protein n=1 Tax=Castilleja foliolosa TaxID=1961234 RepID=A0ABD3C4X9_9LAMI